MRFLSRYRPFFLIQLRANRDKRDLAKRLIEERWRREGCVRQMRVTGGSMEPTLHAGSRIAVHYCMAPKLTQGELVYLRRGTERVVHRVVLTLGPFLVERGDANDYYGIHFISSAIGIVRPVLIADLDTAIESPLEPAESQ